MDHLRDLSYLGDEDDEDDLEEAPQLKIDVPPLPPPVEEMQDPPKKTRGPNRRNPPPDLQDRREKLARRIEESGAMSFREVRELVGGNPGQVSMVTDFHWFERDGHMLWTLTEAGRSRSSPVVENGRQ